MKYVNDFIKAKCAPDLLALQLFPNAKEITKTAAMFWLVTETLQKYGIKRSDNVVLYETGCGVVPRTAAFFAYRTFWRCHAIDPKLKDPLKDWGDRIYTHAIRDDQFDPNMEKEVQYYSISWEKEQQKFLKEAEAVVVVSIHGHGNPKLLYDKIKHENKAVFEMPCCNPSTLHEGRFKIDHGILSPKNVIYWTGSENLFDNRYRTIEKKILNEKDQNFPC